MMEEEEKQPLLNGGASGSHTQYSEKTSLLGPGEKKDKEEEKKDKGKPTATLGQLFRYATCLDVFFMVVGSLAAMVHGAGWPILFIFFGDMTDTFVTGPQGASINTTDHNQTINDFDDTMTKYSLRYVYVGAAVFVASYFQVSLWTVSCERQVHKIRKAFFNAIVRQEIGWFDKQQSGELTTRLADDLERVREGLGDKFSFLIQFLAAFIAGFTVGFVKGWKMALVMMSLTPLLAVCAAFLSKLMASFTKREQDSYAQAGSVAEEVLSCIRTVISFNGQNQDLRRYKESLEESKKLGIKKSFISGFGLGFTFLCMFSAYALAFWYGTEQVKDWYSSGFDGGLSPGTVLTVFFCVLVGTFSIGNATPHLGTLAAAKGAAAVLIDIIDNKPKIDASSNEGERLRSVRGEIEFKGVSFTYPTREEVKVLKDFNLTIKPGQTIALVGHSGCGKSTVVNLMQRFYDPDTGGVVLDGHDIRSLNLKWLRQNIGIVSQEPVLFGFTIKENILLGRPDASDEEVQAVSRAANAHDFISTLPQGYDTLVGERGAQLSGGQKQRVAIARALIRNPKILLLDEATSALDTESESVVQAALDKAVEGRTTIVIAHRLSTIQNADVIYVLKEGEIVEHGKHAELMALQGEYHQQVTLQSLVEEDSEEEEEEEEADNDEALDTVTDADRKRKRTISSDSKTRRSSRQLSRQTSRQTSKAGKQLPHKSIKSKGGEEEEEEEVTVKPRYCRILQENAPEWPFIVIGCCAAAINGCTMPVFAIFFSEMIKVFINKGENGTFWSMMFLVLGGVQFLTNFLQAYSFGQSGERLTMRLRLQTFTSMLRQDVAYFDDPKHSTGALTTRLATDASQIKNATGIRIATILQSVFGLVAALVISFYYGWKLALVVLGGVPLMGLAGFFQMKTVMGTYKKDNTDLELAGKTASETIENIRTVQGITRELHFYDKYCAFLRNPYRTNIKVAQVQGLSFAFSQGIVFMIYAGAFRFGAYMVSLGEMTPDNVFKVFFAISFTGITIGQASSFLPDYSKAKNAAALIFKILDTIPLIDVYSKRGIIVAKTPGVIELKNVRFCYPMRPDFTVLKGINLTVEAGQTVALVGPSGCGKSTIVSLLQRYYDPVEGIVEVDGTNIRDMNLVRLRYLISVVSQEPVLFDCSIRENITYGLDSPVAMEEVISAARAANAHDFIANLPLGYDTVVGEKGAQLSGGQKQRVAIARALVRNPQILLLDEATSALDTESEQLVQSALDNAQEGRTCIVIAHRLSTIQNADVICVIDGGQIVERGNHQQLLAKKGVYAQLVTGQKLIL